MNTTYTIDEIKKMIPSLDLNGTDTLKKLLLKEKEFFQKDEIKNVFLLLNARITWLKDKRPEWRTEFCDN
jgi:hypothetical protein